MIDQEREELIDQLVAEAEYLNRLLYMGKLDKLGDVDLPLSQVRTLALLEGQGPLRMTTIAALMARGFSAVTATVDRLEERGLVTREPDPADGRALLCSITDHGAREIGRFWHLGREVFQDYADLMTLEELRKSVAGLVQLREVEQRVQQALLSGPADRQADLASTEGDRLAHKWESGKRPLA